jgi:ADP-heptose:LPS heptosyltransferase
LGDVLITLPVLRTLREKDSSAFVELAAPFPAALLALYGGAHSAYDLNSAAFLSLFVPGTRLDEALCEKLRHVDCVISYLSDPERTISPKIKSCGCRFISGPFQLTQRRMPAPVQLGQPLAELGLVMADPIPRLFLKSQRVPAMRAVFHVGSGSPAKNWPIPSWRALAAKLEEQFDELLLVSGEADEAPTAEFLRTNRVSKLKVQSNLPILELAQELAAGTLFIGHDTGVTHLAAALGIPTVALFGPTDPLIWKPLGDHVRVVSSTDGTMESLRFELVWEAVRTLVAGSLSQGDSGTQPGALTPGSSPPGEPP